MKKIILPIVSLLLISFYSFGTGNVFTAVTNGAWSDEGTWGGHSTPGNNATVNVPSGFSVTLDFNSPTFTNMTVNISGTFTITDGAKLDMDANGLVNVYTGGTLVATNGGAKIRIDGNNVFVGSQTKTGPFAVNKNGIGGLPIELAYFTATPQSGNVVINWVTATETNNNFFTIERSSDATTFEEVAQVTGAGTCSKSINYSFTDNAPLKGISYYRLRQTDYDGKSVCFNIVAVNRVSIGAVSVYPTLLSQGGIVNIDFTSAGTSTAVVNIYSVEGKLVSTNLQSTVAGQNMIRSNINMPAGQYLLQLIVGNEIQTKTVFVN